MKIHDEGDTIMRSHKIVLARVYEKDAGSVLFSNALDGEVNRIESYRMDFDTFQEMNGPTEITVTIEPGDMLNANL